MATELQTFDLFVRGEIPRGIEGSLLVASSRRNKHREVFSRWHDAMTDLIRLDLYPGRPGRIRATLLPVDPLARGLDDGNGKLLSLDEDVNYGQSSYGYAAQPNHATNAANGSVWATNLLFGAPLEVDLTTWQPRRVLRYLDPSADAPGMSGTSHFAWDLVRGKTYFHQSLLTHTMSGTGARTEELRLVELDLHTGSARLWPVDPPPGDRSQKTMNFHSAFYFEDRGRRFVGLLRTGAVVGTLRAEEGGGDYSGQLPGPAIWIIPIEPSNRVLRAELLPGLNGHRGIALSHLSVDTLGGDGFVLFANCKQADVGRETQGDNVYGEPAAAVAEHYRGMVVEAFNYGSLLRYEWRGGAYSLKTFERSYDYGKTSLGHTWLPINIEMDPTGDRLFCSFSGLRPRLVSKHIAQANAGLTADFRSIRYIPPLLMRFDARALEPDYDRKRTYLSYAEPMAMTVAGDRDRNFAFTFSPEIGLRIYDSADLSRMLCHAVSSHLKHWGDTHLRPEPAHLEFVRR